MFLHEELHRGRQFSKLRDKTVTIAGCGALGSWTSVILARSGVSSFVLYDKDRVEMHNTSTQAFTLENLNQSKVRALSGILYQINKARARTYFVEVNESNVEEVLSSGDLTICTFDNYESRRLMKEYACKLNVPCLFGGINGKAEYGEVKWASNYLPPPDPETINVDPCSYPLSTTLVLFASSVLAESAIEFLLTGRKKGSSFVLRWLFRET